MICCHRKFYAAKSYTELYKHIFTCSTKETITHVYTDKQCEYTLKSDRVSIDK